MLIFQFWFWFCLFSLNVMVKLFRHPDCMGMVPVCYKYFLGYWWRTDFAAFRTMSLVAIFSYKGLVQVGFFSLFLAASSSKVRGEEKKNPNKKKIPKSKHSAHFDLYNHISAVPVSVKSSFYLVFVQHVLWPISFSLDCLWFLWSYQLCHSWCSLESLWKFSVN